MSTRQRTSIATLIAGIVLATAVGTLTGCAPGTREDASIEIQKASQEMGSPMSPAEVDAWAQQYCLRLASIPGNWTRDDAAGIDDTVTLAEKDLLMKLRDLAEKYDC